MDEKRRVLSIDLETFSDIDLSSCGVYRYVEGDFHTGVLAALMWWLPLGASSR